jgi:hypothetical protein
MEPANPELFSKLRFQDSSNSYSRLHLAVVGLSLLPNSLCRARTISAVMAVTGNSKNQQGAVLSLAGSSPLFLNAVACALDSAPELLPGVVLHVWCSFEAASALLAYALPPLAEDRNVPRSPCALCRLLDFRR